MEDDLKAQAEKEKAKLVQEWEEKLKRAVEEARKLEQLNSQNALNKVREQFETQINVLDGKVKTRDENILKL